MPEALLDAEERRNGTLALALLSLFVGGLSGLVCATFRLLLQRADTLRGGLIALAHDEGSMGFLFVIAVAAAATAVAAGLVRRISPDAGGRSANWPQHLGCPSRPSCRVPHWPTASFA